MKPNPPIHLSTSPLFVSRLRSRVWLLSLLILSSFILHLSSFAQTAAPLVIPFQGQITNQQNALVATGQYSLIFNLYDVTVGGQPLWTERHSKVGVVNGMVNVFLGSISSLAAVDFSQTRYLGITVDVDDKPTTADPEMVPRQMIIPAFHAKKTEKMMAFDATSGQSLGTSFGWSALFSNGDPATGTIAGAKLAGDSVTSAKITDGTIVAADFSAALQADSVMPAGTVLPFAGMVLPAGWLWCDGSSVSRTTYARLYAAIQLTYQTTADGASFNVPDMKGRVPVGSGQGTGLTNRALAAKFGEENHTLTPTEMPIHSHVQDGHFHGAASGQLVVFGAGGSDYVIGTPGNNQSNIKLTVANTATVTPTNQNAGGGAAHNVMQPSIVLNYIIKY